MSEKLRRWVDQLTSIQPRIMEHDRALFDQVIEEMRGEIEPKAVQDEHSHIT